MEVVLNLGRFECLGQSEMLSVDGGANVNAGEAVLEAVGVTVAVALLACAGPVGGAVGILTSVGAAAGWATGSAMALTGAGLFGKITGLY